MFNTPYIFHSPLWLLALAIPPAIWWLRSRRSTPVLIVPYAAAWHRPTLTGPSRLPAILATLALILLTAALARPQKVEDKHEVHTQGYDLMLVIDLSGSMNIMDYEDNGQRIDRLQAIKPVIKAFVNDRPNDRIGLVVFSDQAYTLSPLTFDHDWLRRQLERLYIGLAGQQTAIGDGLGVALTRLEQKDRTTPDNQRQGAFIILLTDGENNRGVLTPQQATTIAKDRRIPIYTIGAGTDAPIVPYPNLDAHGNKIDNRLIPGRNSPINEEALRTIARETGGQYYRARDSHTIKSAFADIDRARKIEFQSKSYLVTTEYYHYFAAAGALLFLLAALAARSKKAWDKPQTANQPNH
jgi:Ca-activated chloride channel family protein